MRRPINTVNGTYKDPNLHFSAQDALNVIPMMAEKGGTRTLSKYVDAPGLKPFCRIGVNDGEAFTAAGAGRGARVVDGKLFVVAGRSLWQVTPTGVSINYGTIPGVRRVSMAHNQQGLGNELAIDNGQSRYVYNTQTKVLQKVVDESFPGSVRAFFIDGYIGYVEPQGRYWGHSDLSNALNYNAFDAYEAEGQPDRIVSAHVSHREVLIFGQETIEPYVNSPSGSGEAPFVRASNTVIEYGCSARDSVCSVGPFTVFLDQNRTVQVLNGYTPVPISTSVIDSALQECSKQEIANAYAFALEAEGFQIYYLTVPGRFTFGYDFKNKEWHRRSSTGLDWWAVTDVVQWNGKWYALDSRAGEILELSWRDYPFDVQQELVREWVTGTISADQNPVFVHELELLFGCGGQEYSPVDFPEQPVGPTVSGAAPDGAIGIPWGPYNYTAADGTPPYSFSLRPGGVLPPGIASLTQSGTISAGTPTTIGEYPFTVRATDANGLYADLSDQISIVNPVLVAGPRVSIGEPSAFVTNNSGASWSPIPNASMTLDAGKAAYSDGVWVLVTSASSRYSSDLVTWQTGTVSGAGGALVAVAGGDGIFVGVGVSDTVLRSVNGGASFSAVTTPGTSNWGSVGYGNGRWIIGSTSNDPHLYSDDGCATLTSFGSNVLTYQMLAVEYANDMWQVGGGTSIPSAAGEVAVSLDGGTTWDKRVTNAPSMVVALSSGNGYRVGVCHNGEIIFSDDEWETHAVSPFALPGSTVNRYVAYDGARFVFTDDNGFSNLVVYSSADLQTFAGPFSVALTAASGMVAKQ